MIFLFTIFAFVRCHNWIHGDSRCHHACVATPAPPRPGPRQPHRALGPGQHFVVEWVTGHQGFFYYVVLKASDEGWIKWHSFDSLDDYINQAPDSAWETYRDPKWERIHTCWDTGNNDKTQYEGPVLEGDPRWIDPTIGLKRDNAERGLGTQWRYTEEDRAEDARVAYHNPEYHWIEAVHRFKLKYGFGQEPDMARMDIPGRGGSGEYIVHMMWKAFTDVIDVDFLPEPANDIYGTLSENKRWVKIEHCQFPNTSMNQWAKCHYFQAGESVFESLNLCSHNGWNRCQAINCVPLFTPSLVKHIDGTDFRNANVGWHPDEDVACEETLDTNTPYKDCWEDQAWANKNRNECIPENIPDSADENTFVCGGMLIRQPADPAFNAEMEANYYIRDDDPEDPAFYSTCFVQETTRVFNGNVACQACEEGAADPVIPKWRIGHKCLSCEDAAYPGQSPEDVTIRGNYDVPEYTLKKWEFAEKCTKCF